MNNENNITRYVFDLTLLCAEHLRAQTGGDDKEVFKIVFRWAEEFNERINALSEDELIERDYLLEIDTFAQSKLGNNGYWPIVRLLSRIMDGNSKAGYSENLELPVLGPAIAMVINQDNHKALLLCSDFHGPWHKSVVIPEAQFDEPARVLEAVTWFDKADDKTEENTKTVKHGKKSKK